ncbi:Eukaryotic translation initiation factor 3 subunit J [Kappamyces sp. JEL0829]|nr:Eukaryotic translation initiation factor 3 subunit J [Kappamyces sp. JEL0829]
MSSDDEWDKSDTEPVALSAAKVAASKWADEDVSDGEVKDSWDADSDEEKKPAVPAKKASPPPKKKTQLQQKLAERKAAEQAAQAQKEAEKNETAIERKVRLANSVMESDLENARALVGDLEISRPKPEVEGELHLGNMVPGSRTELLEYADLFKKKLDTFNSHASYSVFAEQVVRDLVAPLTVDETRKISSSLTAILNEKQKALKEAQGKGKKKSTNTKKGVVVARGAINEMGDLGNDAYDEFDDFM